MVEEHEELDQIRRAQAGQPQAFDALVDRYWERVYLPVRSTASCGAW
jgi:hypothetical protein